MTLPDKVAELASRVRHPKTTVRWRLTLLYGGLFLASGAVLLAITYTLVDDATTRDVPFRAAIQFTTPPGQSNTLVKSRVARENFVPAKGPGTVPPPVERLLRSKSGREAALFLGSDQRVADLHQLVVESSIALAIMAVISTLLGWLVAGRVLSPLRTMTATTREISEANLHERLAMRGPPDELRQLADTIDDLLGRLQGAFDAQRSFVANASHELRTPLTATRALLEMVLSDPDATIDTFRLACHQVLEESEQQEQLIDALLVLAHSRRGIERPAPVDLAQVTDRSVRTHAPQTAARGLTVETSLEPAVLSGDRRLIDRLVSNLLDNALRHNVASGEVWVQTQTASGRPALTISNTGPHVPADQVQRLLAPFQRLAPERVGYREGLGLGLSIVAAIAQAHGATLQIHPRPEGGLKITVRFCAGAGDRQQTPRTDDLGATELDRVLSNPL